MNNDLCFERSLNRPVCRNVIRLHDQNSISRRGITCQDARLLKLLATLCSISDGLSPPYCMSVSHRTQVRSNKNACSPVVSSDDKYDDDRDIVSISPILNYLC